MHLPRLIFAVVLLVASLPLPVAAEDEAPEPQISFTKDIVPIFVESCYACHNQKTKKGKYDMSSYKAIMEGGGKGAAIKPGDPYESTLVLMMYGDEIPTMPKDADLLDEAVVAKVDLWVKQGAKFDGPDPALDLRELLPKKETSPAPTDYSLPTPTTALAFAPDGKTLAAAGYHEITFWNPENGGLLSRLPTQSERIHEIQYSSDGKYLLHAGGTPGQLGEVIVWDLESHKPFRELLKSEDIVYAASFSPDGKQVAAGGTDRIFRIWNLDDGKLLHSVENHADWILDIAFTPDGKRIVTASRDKSVKVWDQTTKEPILTFPSHTDGVYAVTVSPDGKTAASTGADGSMRFWNTDGDGKQIRTVSAHTGTSHAVAFSKDGKAIFTAGSDKLVKQWDENGKQVRAMQGHTDWAYSLAQSSDGKRLATGSWNGEIYIWNLEDGKPLQSFIAVPSQAVAKAEK